MTEREMIDRVMQYINRRHQSSRLPSPDYLASGMYSPQWKQSGNKLYYQVGNGPVVAMRHSANGNISCLFNEGGIHWSSL